MEKRLIDANVLPNYKCQVTAIIGDQKGPAEMRFVFWKDIENAPTIDAVPVVHGRWVMMAGFPACSKCGCSPADWEAKPDNPEGYPPYCHSCGTKMDGGAEG